MGGSWGVPLCHYLVGADKNTQSILAWHLFSGGYKIFGLLQPDFPLNCVGFILKTGHKVQLLRV